MGMFMPTRLNTYSVESVTAGHPDKLCDQISDAILDALLAQDPWSRVAVETTASHGKVFICGEVTSKGEVDYEAIARQVYREVGYCDQLDIAVHVVQQSPDIALGVDPGGAGDQGIMWGFATNDTSQYLPLGTVLAHQLTQGLQTLRECGTVPWLRPDGKSQVTIVNGKVATVVVSCQHGEDVSQEEIRETLLRELIDPIIGDIERVRVLVNPSGRFVHGGIHADTGLTGRKIVVDAYGSLCPHGGGCFSGKDPTKVDRSAAYAARQAALSVVASSIGGACWVEVAYAIGVSRPVMLHAFTESGMDVTEIVEKAFDFRPHAIIERLGLRRPIYRETAAYGHFGRAGFPWEEIVPL